MEPSRQRWTQSDRRRKQPSLYDEYLNQEKLSQIPAQLQIPPTRSAIPQSWDPSSATIRTVTPDDSPDADADADAHQGAAEDQDGERNAEDGPGGDQEQAQEQRPEQEQPQEEHDDGELDEALAAAVGALDPPVPLDKQLYLPLISHPAPPGTSAQQPLHNTHQQHLNHHFAHHGHPHNHIHHTHAHHIHPQKEKPASSAPARGVLGRPESLETAKRDHHRATFVGSRRPRTKTLDDKAVRDNSPASRGTFRHGSMHTATPSHSVNDSISSINHPLLVSPLSQTSFSSASTAPPPRPPSPVDTISSLADSMSGPLPNAGAKRILHLMKTLCGRMSGSLQFRHGPAHPWQLSYCYIQEDAGSLMCEPEQDSDIHRVLVRDLRGCQVKTAMDEDSQTPYLDLSLPNSSLELHIRLKDRSDFDSWFAALLCWNPIRPRGIQNRMTKPQSPGVASTSAHLSPESSRRNSDMSLTLREAPVIKVGPMIYWDSNISYSNATAPRGLGRPHVPRQQSYGSHWWRRVSCTLRENGELKLYAEAGANLLSVVQLSQLSRCAIQRLHPSVLDNPFCIAIYPQYTSGATVAPSVRPVYLSLESRILYEVWFVLLRAFTIPQLYGPKSTTPHQTDDASLPQALDSLFTNGTDMFRMERSLSIRIIEARLPHPVMSTRAEINHQHAIRHGQWPPSPQQQDAHYVEILLDGESRGKTQLKHEGHSPFWREDFEYLDLPAVLTSASVLLRRRPPDLATPREQHETRLVHEAYGLLNNGHRSGQSAGFTGISHDQTLGKVEIYLEDLEGSREVEKWWPAVNGYGESVGEILIRARAEENVILMSRDYEPLTQLLHQFDNELTLQIAQMIPTELRRLSDILLNIFQVSGQVEAWLCSLVEEEIDGVHKETPASRLRYSRRIGNEAENAAAITASSERELMVRDMNKNATLEANLLFRGNTLLTKSLDNYMRRVGNEYLLAALGPTIKDINDKDPDCEVDPNRVASDRVLERNWKRLLQCTDDVWHAIKISVHNAPLQFKIIFKHIRACAEDRYGNFLRSVSFSSISGFLFLRFFCPAVLNPKLFGLLEDDPKPRTRRTFTLIAKSLQGLANMASFGSKEHWMEPMNAFLATHRESFKSFIDDVCTLPLSVDVSNTVPSSQPTAYSTPIAIRNRLPLTSREGFPSLPYLIDQAREVAGLIELWLHGTSGKNGSAGIAAAIGKEDGDLLAFHSLCTQLDARTQDCLARAERAERPNSGLSFRWEELIDQLQTSTALSPTSRPQSKQEGIPERNEGNSGRSRLELETPTRDSFDDIAMQAAGEVAVRARGTFALEDLNGEFMEEVLVEKDSHSPQDFENDPDGGAASVAASMLQQEQSTMSSDRRAGMHFRGSFDMQRANNNMSRTNSTMTSLSGEGSSIQTSHSGAYFTSSYNRTERDKEISSDIEASLAGAKRSVFSSGGVRGGSAHGSLNSGVSCSETDSNATTALPSLQKERERREREKEKIKKREREERERRIKDFVPALPLAAFRGRKKDRKEEKTKDGGGSASSSTGGDNH